MDLCSRYFGPLDNTFSNEVLLTLLRSPVITWAAGLNVKWELAYAQLQSGDLDLQSSIRVYN